MTVADIMTSNVAVCTQETSVWAIAQKMVERDCGSIPIVDGVDSLRPVGIVSDRDIVVRLIARGINPLSSIATDCMTNVLCTATPEMSIEDCLNLMEQHQIRRIPVIDAQGRCCGIVAQADIAENAPNSEVVEFLRDVSQPNHGEFHSQFH